MNNNHESISDNFNHYCLSVTNKITSKIIVTIIITWVLTAPVKYTCPDNYLTFIGTLFLKLNLIAHELEKLKNIKSLKCKNFVGYDDILIIILKISYDLSMYLYLYLPVYSLTHFDHLCFLGSSQQVL
jgi:hypothetical protein